jgi:PAS domain-containing protein
MISILTTAFGASYEYRMVGLSITVLVLGGAIASPFFYRFVANQKSDLDLSRERELYFQTMAEALPEIIWTANSKGRTITLTGNASITRA